MARSGPYAAVIFMLAEEQELEPVRWVIESNPSLPFIAVLPSVSAKLRKELEAEGVSEVIATEGLPPAALRRTLRERLTTLTSRPPPNREAESAITTDLHGIRSALTAIQGQAELALAKLRGSPARREPLRAIVREVTEVEGLLRRIERKVKCRAPLLRNDHRS
jgi:signal transduction histidine kinase